MPAVGGRQPRVYVKVDVRGPFQAGTDHQRHLTWAQTKMAPGARSRRQLAIEPAQLGFFCPIEQAEHPH